MNWLMAEFILASTVQDDESWLGLAGFAPLEVDTLLMLCFCCLASGTTGFFLITYITL